MFTIKLHNVKTLLFKLIEIIFSKTAKKKTLCSVNGRMQISLVVFSKYTLIDACCNISFILELRNTYLLNITYTSIYIYKINKNQLIQNHNNNKLYTLQ